MSDSYVEQLKNLSVGERIINLNEIVCNGYQVERSEFVSLETETSKMFKNTYKNENGAGSVLGIQFDCWPYITFHVQTENAYYRHTINYLIFDDGTYHFWHGKTQASSVKSRKAMNSEKKQIKKIIGNILANH